MLLGTARERIMSHLCLLMCRVDDGDAADTAMTELARVALSPARGAIGSTLDTVESQVAAVGQRVLG